MLRQSLIFRGSASIFSQRSSVNLGWKKKLLSHALHICKSTELKLPLGSHLFNFGIGETCAHDFHFHLASREDNVNKAGRIWKNWLVKAADGGTVSASHMGTFITEMSHTMSL